MKIEGIMKIYSVTTVVNADGLPTYGSAGVWHEVFASREEAVNLIKKWGGEPISGDTFLQKKEAEGKVFNFYHTINSHFFGGSYYE